MPFGNARVSSMMRGCSVVPRMHARMSLCHAREVPRMHKGHSLCSVTPLAPIYEAWGSSQQAKIGWKCLCMMRGCPSLMRGCPSFDARKCCGSRSTMRGCHLFEARMSLAESFFACACEEFHAPLTIGYIIMLSAHHPKPSSFLNQIPTGHGGAGRAKLPRHSRISCTRNVAASGIHPFG